MIDDLPAVIPVTARELEVIETYLEALLNKVLGAMASPSVLGCHFDEGVKR